MNKIVNELFTQFFGHTVPLPTALSVDTPQLHFRELHPLIAPVQGTRGQCQQRSPLPLRWQLFHQLHNLRLAQF